MGGVTRIENIFVKVIFGWGLLAAMFTSVPPLNVNVFVGANSKSNSTSDPWWLSGNPGLSNDLGQGGSSTVGEVNISAILNSFQMGYDKRVRPNYGGVPVVVGVTIFILSFSSVSESAMVFNRHTTCYVNFPSKLTKEFPPNVTTHRLRMSHLPSFAKLLQLLSQSGQLPNIWSDRLDPSKKFKRT